MSRRSKVVVVAIAAIGVVIAALLWFGGHTLWNEILALHHRGH